MLRSVPRFLQPAFRQALTFALQQILRARAGAWKLLLLAPQLLLARGAAQGEVGRDVLTKMLEGARGPAVAAGARPVRRAGAEGRCEACALLRRGELPRARQVLTSAQLAPGNEQTLRLLTDPERRPPAARRAIPEEVLAFQPDSLRPCRLRRLARRSGLRDAARRPG